MSKPVIEVRNVKKSFYLPHHANDSLKTAVTQVFKAKDKGGEKFNALDGVSFTVNKGDFFGILGRNGSGKSTLLKIISEIYQPTSGSVKHEGKLVSFIELGVGFRPQLTGRENVFLNGALLGFSKREMEAMYDDIVEFAELEKFMDQKLKNYSSGMKVRLAFSVAIRAEADILILDEVLAVGDAAFKRKCNDYFRSLGDNGKTVILVTHSMAAVRDFCNKAILIEDGKVAFEGSADEIADRYLELFSSQAVRPSKKSRGDERITVTSVDVTANSDEVLFNVVLTASTDPPAEDVVFGINVMTNAGNAVAGMNNLNMVKPVKMRFGSREKKQFTVRIPNIFGNDTYRVNASVRLKDGVTFCDQKRDIAQFINKRKESYYPVVLPASIENK